MSMRRTTAIACVCFFLLTLGFGKSSNPPNEERVTCGWARGTIVKLVRPKYPEDAKKAGVEGMVSLRCLIGTNGAVKRIEVIKGHDLLTPAAMAAVKQWMYKPYILNGKVVEVETQVNIHFQLPKRKQGAQAMR